MTVDEAREQLRTKADEFRQAAEDAIANGVSDAEVLTIVMSVMSQQPTA